MQEDSHLTEDSLRQALSRLGAEGHRSEQQDNSRQEGGSPSAMRSGVMRGGGQSFGRRRRFVGDDNVIVERPLQSRAAHHRQVGRSSNAAANDQERDEIKRLQQLVKQEQRRHFDAETEIEELKNRLRNIETRVAHFRMQADERSRELRQQQEETIRLRAELMRVSENNKRAERRKMEEKTSHPTPASFKEMRVDDQEPVQWWKD
ncbi:hypothetical protein GS501_06650 [Saccharibacter sp. 17.LH.SD]|uniref:hypothetical protein n=1 Tax=Saccharibacter sp. 17.LH.SD TaxID=2689393 RepID=UPI00136ADDB4|nr:hypothetical protein [Saccharibacter sp. 17.LH.SD]MXV44718.1 hypothetical protein [Saccharibacter sp. 17.LH.SD]